MRESTGRDAGLDGVGLAMLLVELVKIDVDMSRFGSGERLCPQGAMCPGIVRAPESEKRPKPQGQPDVAASEAFSRIDNYVLELRRMLHRRYPQKSSKGLIDQYWSATGRKGVFAVKAGQPKERSRSIN